MNSSEQNKQNYFTESGAIVNRHFDNVAKKADSLKINNVQIHEDNYTNHQSMKNLSQLVMEYKLSLEYSPSIGIYLMPTFEDFFVWEFDLFLRDGYYKDCLLKGKIYFSKERPKQITQAMFLTPVYHPLVHFQTGKIDIKTLNSLNQINKGEVLFAFLLSLKDMFTNPEACKLQGSYNDQASKTYRKSEILFVQQIFEISILRIQDESKDRIPEESLSGQILQNLDIDQADFVSKIKQKLAQICPKNQLNNTKFSCQIQEEQRTEQKISRLLKIIMNQL